MGCRCGIRQEGQELKLVADCRSCKDGKGDLDDPVCLSGVLEGWTSGLGADSIVLSGTLETQYSSRTIEVLRRLADLHADLTRMAARAVPPAGKAGSMKEQRRRCGRCRLAPSAVFPDLAKGLVSDLEAFYEGFRKVAVTVADASFNDRTCASCLEATKDDVAFVFERFEGFVRYIIKEGFSIVL